MNLKIEYHLKQVLVVPEKREMAEYSGRDPHLVQPKKSKR